MDTKAAFLKHVVDDLQQLADDQSEGPGIETGRCRMWGAWCADNEGATLDEALILLPTEKEVNAWLAVQRKNDDFGTVDVCVLECEVLMVANSHIEETLDQGLARAFCDKPCEENSTGPFSLLA